MLVIDMLGIERLVDGCYLMLRQIARLFAMANLCLYKGTFLSGFFNVYAAIWDSQSVHTIRYILAEITWSLGHQ